MISLFLGINTHIPCTWEYVLHIKQGCTHYLDIPAQEPENTTNLIIWYSDVHRKLSSSVHLSSLHISTLNRGNQLRKSLKASLIVSFIILQQVILTENILGYVRILGCMRNPWTALTSPGLPAAFETVLSFLLHCYICNGCHSLDLNLCHLYIVFIFHFT